jgi:5-methylcytosine-specific restriction protein A
VRRTGPTAATRDAVYERAGFACERCGRTDGPFAVHHRRPRAMGGSRLADTNALPNLLLLDDDCHRYVEANREEALAHGYLVPQGKDPAAVPVTVGMHRTPIILTVHGYRLACPQGEGCTDQTACSSCPSELA